MELLELHQPRSAYRNSCLHLEDNRWRYQGSIILSSQQESPVIATGIMFRVSFDGVTSDAFFLPEA